jgi:hypothetical protein
MKVRVYISASESYLFENVDKISDGTNEISSSTTRKLVLMRKSKKGVEYYAIAVFNQWQHWKGTLETKPI